MPKLCTKLHSKWLSFITNNNNNSLTAGIANVEYVIVLEVILRASAYDMASTAIAVPHLATYLFLLDCGVILSAGLRHTVLISSSKIEWQVIQTILCTNTITNFKTIKNYEHHDSYYLSRKNCSIHNWYQRPYHL